MHEYVPRAHPAAPLDGSIRQGFELTSDPDGNLVLVHSADRPIPGLPVTEYLDTIVHHQTGGWRLFDAA
jgi:hypothetical protein